MQKWTIVLSLACFVSAGCHKGNPMEPTPTTTTPNGAIPVAQAAKVQIQLNQAVDRTVNAISMTLKGVSGSDELINGLPLSEPLTATDRWSGALIHVLSYNAVVNGQVGWSGNTNIPFTPPSHDHFQFDSIPTNGTLDIAIEMIPGNQPVGGPFHLIKVDPSASNVEITSPLGARYTFEKDSSGLVHIKGPRPY